MTRKKRVAHLVRKCLPPFTSFIRNQIMNHMMYDAIVVYKEFIDSDFAREIIENIPSLHCDGNKNGVFKIYSDLLYGRPFRRLTNVDKKNIAKYVCLQEIDIIHYHYGTDAGMFIGAVPTRIPSIVSFYGYDCSSFPNWYFGSGANYLRKVFRHVDYCLAMSDDMGSDLLKLGCPEDKIIVHYYGTDVQRFACRRNYDAGDEIVLLSLGYLVPQKGHAFTLKALEKAVKLTGRKLLLRIVGEGRLELSLRRQVDELSIADYVRFVGPLKYMSREFLEEYCKADIFIHPSVTSETNEKEGIPGTIVEAMASGLPVISTFHAGIPHIICDGKTGLLVKEWDVDALTNAIVKCAGNVSLREKIGLAARKHALENLDLKKKQVELENIYDRVIEEHSRKS